MVHLLLCRRKYGGVPRLLCDWLEECVTSGDVLSDHAFLEGWRMAMGTEMAAYGDRRPLSGPRHGFDRVPWKQTETIAERIKRKQRRVRSRFRVCARRLGRNVCEDI